MCDAHHYLLDTTFTRYGSKLYNQIVGIRMGTNYVPLFAEFFFMRETSLFLIQTIIKLMVLKLLTSRYLDD